MNRPDPKWWWAFGSMALLISLIPMGCFGPVGAQSDSGWRRCAHLSGAANIDSRAGVRLCNTDFALLHSPEHRAGLIAVERLSRATVLDADEEREDSWRADRRLPKGQRAEVSDYRGSGWDRGHLAAAANRSTPQAMQDSFLLSNAAPQHPALNRGPWAKIEADTRKYALRAAGSVLVITGVLYQPQAAGSALAGGVSIPSHWWKVVKDETSGRAWGWVMPNDATARMTEPRAYSEIAPLVGNVLGAPR